MSRLTSMFMLASACLAGSAAAQVIELVPVSSTGLNTINGNEIVIPEGGVQVQFDVMISGWANAPGSPGLAAVSATLDPSGLLGENAVPPLPGLDLTTPAPVPCVTDGDCPNGFCGSFQAGFCDASQPAFQIDSVCSDDPSIVCSVDSQCSGGADCVFDGFGAGTACDGRFAVILPPSGEIEWIAACPAAGVPDPGAPIVLGSLRIDVPAGAGRTYTIALNDSIDESFMTSDEGAVIFVQAIVSGVIQIPPPPPIPAASKWGIVIMMFSLLIVGTLVLKSRGRVARVL